MNVKTDDGPTLKDVAEAAGLSVTAVSKVINNREGVSASNRKRVMQILEEMGYRGRGGKPAAALRELEAITVITLDRYVTDNTFYNEIVEGVLEEASEQGVPAEFNIVPSAALAAGETNLLWSEAPQAAVLIGLDRREVIDAVCTANVPAVIANGMDRSMRISSVSPDYHFGGWEATRYLLDQGHSDIVHVTHTHRESIKLRLDGFRDALEEAGIAFSPERHVLDLGSPNRISFEAREVVDRFLANRNEMPSALFCVADIVALAAIQAIQARGLSVPDDISVMGFDDLPIGAHSTPPLTTMQIDRQEVGRMAIRLLMERISGKKATVKRVGLNVDLIERRSVAAPSRT
ncbi:LacI family DNA-binding transcriptional regulator [Consotaella aegiceratis]|uniref:LacI family DNA-binding transcriptional regulator n=1 Tax=Consotaella aegiceratis TaxID=3097961 RepID=UPI002F3F30C3